MHGPPPSVVLRHRPPSAGARPVLSGSWLVKADRCPTAVEGLVADASAQIYFNLGPRGRVVHRPDGPPRACRRSAWVVGPRSRRVEMAKETEDSDIVAVTLRPAAARSVLGVPARELRDMVVDLEELWGDEVERIREALAGTTDPDARLELVERAVCRRAARFGSDDSSGVATLCRRLGGRPSDSIASVAEESGLTHRRVIEMLEREVGLKPAEFRRVQRFQRALQEVATGDVAWTRIAFRSGYSDQPHLIREFRRLAGMTPTEYLERRSPVGTGFVRLVMAR